MMRVGRGEDLLRRDLSADYICRHRLLLVKEPSFLLQIMAHL